VHESCCCRSLPVKGKQRRLCRKDRGPAFETWQRRQKAGNSRVCEGGKNQWIGDGRRQVRRGWVQSSRETPERNGVLLPRQCLTVRPFLCFASRTDTETDEALQNVILSKSRAVSTQCSFLCIFSAVLRHKIILAKHVPASERIRFEITSRSAF
jgi:hypothetical protein